MVVGTAKVVGPPVIVGATGGLGVGLLGAGAKVLGSARNAPQNVPLQAVVKPTVPSAAGGSFLGGVPRWALYGGAAIVAVAVLSKRR